MPSEFHPYLKPQPALGSGYEPMGDMQTLVTRTDVTDAVFELLEGRAVVIEGDDALPTLRYKARAENNGLGLIVLHLSNGQTAYLDVTMGA
jgi:hypothetical protein